MAYGYTHLHMYNYVWCAVSNRRIPFLKMNWRVSEAGFDANIQFRRILKFRCAVCVCVWERERERERERDRETERDCWIVFCESVCARKRGVRTESRKRVASPTFKFCSCSTTWFCMITHLWLILPVEHTADKTTQNRHMIWAGQIFALLTVGV